MRVLIAATLLAIATPVLADETTGEVLAYDRVDHILVLMDKTVWELPATLELPADLAKGDRIHIDFTEEGDAGIVSIEKITRVSG